MIERGLGAPRAMANCVEPCRRGPDLGCSQNSGELFQAEQDVPPPTVTVLSAEQDVPPPTVTVPSAVQHVRLKTTMSFDKKFLDYKCTDIEQIRPADLYISLDKYHDVVLVLNTKRYQNGYKISYMTTRGIIKDLILRNLNLKEFIGNTALWTVFRKSSSSNDT
jgi:hypothetical protein